MHQERKKNELMQQTCLYLAEIWLECPVFPWSYKEVKVMVSQNKTVIFEGAFLFRLKTTCFGPFTGPSSGLKWNVIGDYTV
jgi:hypothetical protein